MKTYQTIDELIQDSVAVKDEIIRPGIFGIGRMTLQVSSWAQKFNYQFSCNNMSIAFVYGNQLYSTPYTKGAIQILYASNFKLTCFYVPFSDWSNPNGKEDRVKWERLVREAKEDSIEVFENECISFCNDNGILPLDQSILDNCLAVPYSGFNIHDCYIDNVFYPIIRPFDNNFSRYLGKYCYNNGKIIFVYINGTTYLAKGQGLVSILEQAGFEEDLLFIPLTNGEVITDKKINKLWNNLNEF